MQRKLVQRELTREGPRQRLGVAPRGAALPSILPESPLGWLHAHGHLDDRLFDAGERLRTDYERAQIAPGITTRWEPVRTRGVGGARLAPTERQVAARQRFDGAIEAAGKGLDDILWRVVCACETVPAAEKALDWPARSGKLVLRLALDRVADFYRIRVTGRLSSGLPSGLCRRRHLGPPPPRFARHLNRKRGRLIESRSRPSPFTGRGP